MSSKYVALFVTMFCYFKIFNYFFAQCFIFKIYDTYIIPKYRYGNINLGMETEYFLMALLATYKANDRITPQIKS
jgi:hypothetical protein